MGKRKNYVGQKIAHYTIISDAKDLINSKGQHQRMVWCKCDCGNPELQLVNLYYLIYGNVQGCKNCKSKRDSERQKNLQNNRKYNIYDFLEDCVYIYPQDRKDIYTIVDYKWYEYLKDKYVYPKKDRNNGYYWCFKENKKVIRLHNIIGGKGYDHINLNKSDNRESNLRPSTIAENARNRKGTKRNQSGYKGVFLDKKTGKYIAEIRYNYKLYYLGSFDVKEDAAKEYDKASLFLFKEFAWLNFPDEKYENMENYQLPKKSLDKRKRTNKTGYRGVYESGKKYIAKCRKNTIGKYDTKEEAAKAYDDYLRTHGIDGLFNFEEENI